MKHFNFFFHDWLSTENGPTMDRHCIEIDTAMSRKIFKILFVLFLCVGNMWGAKITDYTKIVSGGTYYIGATLSNNTDYYFKASAGTSVMTTADYGTSASSTAQATPVIITISGTTGTIQFENGNYLHLDASNGKYLVSSSSQSWTFSNQSSKIRLTNNSRALQRNNNAGTDRFGSYASSQTDVWLEEATPAVTYTLNYHDGDGTGTRTSVAEGSNLITALGTPSNSCDATSTTFVGWSTTEITTKTNTKPTFVAANAVVNSTTAAATYYAVYAKCVYTKISDHTDLTSGDQIVIRDNKNSNIVNNDFTATSDKTSTTTISPLAKQIWTITGDNTNGWTFKSGTVTLGFSTTPTSSNKTQSVSNTTTNSSAWKFANLSGTYSGCISIKKGTAVFEYSSGWKVYYNAGDQYAAMQIFQAIYSEYMTTCCTPLGSINGSFNFTNVSSTSVTVGVPSDYSDKDNANLEGYIFKRYAASTGGSAVETIETNAADKTTATFSTGLVANTTYYYTIIAKHSSSSCNSAETSPRKSYKIDSYVVSYANGGGSGTNPGAHDPVLANSKVTLKSNTFDAPTGKEFRVWNDGTSDLDEGEEYTVTANTVMTAQWQCMEPGFTKNLSTTQVNYLQGETAAKLSVTAAANGAELSYAWEMSANGTTGWSSVGINSNEYKPSTATAGDQYYHCIVTNLAEGCTESKATSAVAHIHVDVPAACLEPVISVASGTYYEDKSVTITCGTEGAAIYYTTDGGAPGSGSTLYTGAITVDHSMTIKAIAIKAEMENSTIVEATYTIKCVTPTIVLAAGNYTGVQTTTITKGYGTKIYYTTDGSTPSNTNGTEYTGAVSIDQPMTLKAIVWKDGCTNSEVASAAYTLKCTTPTFNKETGTYTGVQSITLSAAGADIYYTLDGTAPSKTNGTKYTAAIEVSANQTVKAIAVKEGWGDSEIASATYTIQYNVYWWVNGVAWTGKGGSTLVTYGQTATAPTTTPTKADGCGDKFMGWTETQNYENDNTAPIDMFTETSAAITKETNFYAVFADYGEEE